MKKNILIAFVMFLSSGLLLAQESEINKTYISSFGTSIGFNAFLVENTNASYLGLKSSVDDDELFVDPSLYKQGNSFGGAASFSMQFNLGITPFSKKKNELRTNREWRVGLITNLGNRRNFDYYSENSFTFDTLQSNNGYNDVYADSVYQENYFYNEQIFDVSLNVAYLINTGTQRRTYFYTGVGAHLGIAVKSETKIYTYDNEEVIYYDQGNKPSEQENWYWSYWNKENSGEYETRTANINSGIYFARAYIPLGFNFKISKRNQFWKHMNLYTELNPGVEFQIVSGDKTYVNPFFGLAWIGVSYKW